MTVKDSVLYQKVDKSRHFYIILSQKGNIISEKRCHRTPT